MSITQAPSSTSLGASTASPAASPWQTTSSTSKPDWWTHLITFWRAVWAPVTMLVSTSSRWPVIPTASLTPSWPSTVKARGIRWMTWRSLGMLTARAASTTRSTSGSAISRSARDTATTPRLFWDQRWGPASETTTDSTRKPAMRSAPRTADWIAETVLSMLTTTPLRRPSLAASPAPTTFKRPYSSSSPITTATLEVPRSRPVMRFRLDNEVWDASCDVGWDLAGPGKYMLCVDRLEALSVGEVGRGRARHASPLQVVAAERGQVVEDPDAEGHDGGDREVDPELVADIGQPRRQRHVRHQAGKEDPRLVAAGDVGLEGAEDRVQRGQQRDRRVARVPERDGDRREQAQHEPYQGEDHGDQD